MVKLSVVIATFNRAACLTRTLESLASQTGDPAEYEIVAVNNNSTDNTPEAFAVFTGAHPELQLSLVFEKKQGLSHARNAGIVASRGEIIAIIDDDEEVNLEFVQAYIDFFDAYPQVAAAGGRIVPQYEVPPPQWISPYAERPIAGPLDLGDRILEMPAGKYPGGGNMAIRRSVIEQYGVFNPELGRTGNNPMGGEEKELFGRLHAGGEKIYYVPGAVIYHIIPPSKLTSAYFTRLSRMTGVSERIRSKAEGSYGRRLLGELVRWGGSLVLAVGYFFSGHPAKGGYLLRMRWNISRGLLNV